MQTDERSIFPLTPNPFRIARALKNRLYVWIVVTNFYER